jgi:glycosyltransferase involved in cell wall biosynthesis
MLLPPYADMTRIGIETISAGAGFGASAGGMTVYYHGLIGELRRRVPRGSLVVIANERSLAAGDLEANPDVVACHGIPSTRVGRIAYEQLALPMVARRAHLRVLISTCNVAPMARACRSVVVIQSLQFMDYPEAYGRARAEYLRRMVAVSARRADAVVAVSRWSKDQIVDRLGVSPDRIVVAPHGLSTHVRAAMETSDIPGDSLTDETIPIILFVSSFYRFKNHSRLIQAFARVADTIPHRLVLVGRAADVPAHELEDVARREGVAHRVRLVGPMRHEAVPALIRSADVVAYPSLYETFGHPVIEAMALGRPIVTSARGATAEVAGDVGILIDPLDVDSIAQGLLTAATDGPTRTRAAIDGPLRANGFTWARSAAAHLEAVDLALGRSRRRWAASG